MKHTTKPADISAVRNVLGLIRAAASMLESGLQAMGKTDGIDLALSNGASLRVVVDFDHPPRITGQLLNGADVLELFSISPEGLFEEGAQGLH